jgi:hypothetical protein
VLWNCALCNVISLNMIGVHLACVLKCWYFVIRLYTTRVKCIITLLSLHVSALLGHHQVTNVYNYNI